MRTKEEIENKIAECYKLLNENKIDILRAIITTDALAWVLGEDYLDFDNSKEEIINRCSITGDK